MRTRSIGSGLKNKFILPMLFAPALATSAIDAEAGTTKPYTLRFETQCGLIPQKGLNVSVALKLRGSDSEKFFAVSCFQNTGKCVGAELRLSESKVGFFGLLPQNFDAQKVTVTASTATVIYNNVTMTVDTKEKKVKMTIDFGDRNPPTEEIWEGSCE